jgi:HlyD family secretion protein
MPTQTNKDQIMDAFQKLKNKRLIIGGIIVVLLGLGSFAFVSLQSAGKNQAKSTQSIKTAEVTKGDLTTEVSGTGKIVAPNAVDLAFSTTGKVAELNVNPGNQVAEGDVLAKLDRIAALQETVETAKLSLTKAQQTLDDLVTNKEVTLANALIAQSDAAAALEKAKLGVVNKYSPRCVKNVTEVYYFDYMYARSDYLFWYNALINQNTGYGDMYIQERMAPYKLKMDQSYSNWKYCEGFSELEIEQSDSSLEKTQSAYDKAKEYYEKLKANDGIDPDTQAIAEATKKNAELQLEQAQNTLDGATLVSPMDGTILTVASAVGEILDKDTYQSPYIEIANLSKPVLQATFDESDLASINTNCTASASFTSLADKKYEGTITQINPALSENNSVASIEAYISLKNDPSAEVVNLPVGLNATIELTCPLAKDVLMVPLQALKNEDNGQAQVYVQNTDGTSTAHTVTIGLKTMSFAEVSGDIKAGEKVITSTIK